MFATRILGPLRWFGLMEWREPQEIFEVGCWRKTFEPALARDRPHRTAVTAPDLVSAPILVRRVGIPESLGPATLSGATGLVPSKGIVLS